jgi:membrane protein required for colicin V production
MKGAAVNPFDMVIVVILGYGVIRGVFRGLIRELAAIAGIAVGFYVAYANYKTISPMLARWITTPAYLDIASFIILFCAVLMIITGVGILIRLIIKVALLGVFDRMLGGIFGGVKGALIVSLMFVLLVSFLPPGGVKMVSDSKLAPYVNAVSKGVVVVIPKEMRESFIKNIEELKKSWGTKT